MSVGTEHRSQTTAASLETAITAGLERIRTQVAGAADAAGLCAHLDTLDGRRVELRRRLDDMPDIGGAWGMASDTPLAGLADVLLRVERLEQVLREDRGPAAVASAERVAAEPLPRPVRLMGRQRDVLERVSGRSGPPWLSGGAGR